MQSLSGLLKTKCLDHRKFKTRDLAKQVIFGYIVVFDNRILRHATIQDQVPIDVAQQLFKMNCPFLPASIQSDLAQLGISYKFDGAKLTLMRLILYGNY